MLVVAWCCAMGAWAYDFEADGIYYGITSATDKTVEVVSGYAKYSGDVTIPATVTYDGITYRVTSIGKHAFYDCISLASIVIPKGVTSIGEWAFSGCSSLTSITIPKGVTSIGENAFYYCSSLASIVIPEGVTSIGDYAFNNCSSLASIVIPEGVTTIGFAAFTYCSSLTSIVIPEGVTSIGSSAFSDCSNLTSITIPEGVTRIGNGTFSYCSSLASITIPKGVTSIGDYAFGDCSSLTSITLPESLTSIGEYVFSGCSSLQSIEVDEGNANYRSIDGVLFNKNVTMLISCPGGKAGAYTIPEGVTSIGVSAFSSCTSLQAIHSRAITPPTCGASCFYNVDKNSCTLYVPKGTLEAYKAADEWKKFVNIVEEEIATGEIAENFEVDGISYHLISAEELTVEVVAGDTKYSGDVIIPATVTHDGIIYQVTSIGKHAFYDCISLASIVIPKGVTSIGEWAFSDCYSLASITLPESLTSIGRFAFSGCNGFASIVIPEGVTSIEMNAFSYCSSLASITLPESLTSIGEYVFSGCSSLASIVIPEGVTSIGNRAFYRCSSLASITLPESLTSIGRSAFSGCYGFTSIVIPEGVTTIGDYAFGDCSSLTSITLPESLTSIGEYVFSGCSSLQSIEVDERNTNFKSIDGVLFNKDVTEILCCPARKSGTYTIPAGVISIGSAAFYNCSSLASIVIPERVTTIRDHAFLFCSSLTTIVIPERVTTIGKYVFSGCSQLQSIDVAERNTNFKSIDGVLFDKNATTLLAYPGGKKGFYTIPAEVSAIGDWAFGRCGSLQAIRSQAIIPPTCVKNCFWGVDKDACILFVPKGTLEAYKAADEWKEFVNIVEVEYTGIEEVGADRAGQAVITACGDGIVVENLPAGTAVTVYTLSGTVVYEGVASGSRTELTLPAGHLYLVKCGQSVTKVAL